MSFILDALRRADAERERGRVPGLHAQQLPGAEAGESAGESAMGTVGRSLVPWLLGCAVVLALLGWVVAWLWPRPAIVAPEPQPVAVPMSAAVQPALRVAPAVVQIQPPPLAAVVPAATPPAASQPARDVPLLSELPAGLRSQIPPLNSGGSMYSETPGNRMLILNGQVLHEGDMVAGKLVLEEIRLNGAVLSLQGQRFRIGN